MQNPEIEHFGMAEFCRRVKLSPPVVRGLEAAGVVQPVRTTTGWRAFSTTDVSAARNWKAARQA